MQPDGHVTLRTSRSAVDERVALLEPSVAVHGRKLWPDHFKCELVIFVPVALQRVQPTVQGRARVIRIFVERIRSVTEETAVNIVLEYQLQ